MTTICTKCNSALEANAKFCPNCGRPVDPASQPTRPTLHPFHKADLPARSTTMIFKARKGFWIAFGFVAFIGLFVISRPELKKHPIIKSQIQEKSELAPIPSASITYDEKPIIFDKNWTSVPNGFKGDKIANVGQGLFITKDDFESSDAFKERVEKEANSIREKKHVIILEGGIRLEYNADKKQFEQSSMEILEDLKHYVNWLREEYSYKEHKRMEIRTFWTDRVVFSNISKIASSLSNDGWKISYRDKDWGWKTFQVQMPPIKMQPEEARIFSNIGGYKYWELYTWFHKK